MRTRMSRPALVALVAITLIGLTSCQEAGSSTTPDGSPPPGSAPAPPLPPEYETPIVFVHAFGGSGAQFRSEALRFASNGFPASRIRAFDYGTPAPDEGVLSGFIDDVRAEFKAPKVHLVAHSAGTAVASAFVGNAANAEKIDKIVFIEGLGECPAHFLRCRMVRASEMGQSHVEASTSAESFERQFRFLMGRAPETSRVVPQPADQVEIAGKVLDFEVNAPPVGATGQVWEIKSGTGARVGDYPHATFTVSPDGSFGPIRVNGEAHYEIAVERQGTGKTFHYYFQPFVRSDLLLRLLTVGAGQPMAVNSNLGPDHSAVVVMRYREFWRSKGESNDTLKVFTTGQTPVDVLQPVRNDVVAVHVHDDAATPGESTLSLLPFFPTLLFQTGVDVYLPASDPPSGTITVINTPRGDASRMQSLVAPNWPSSTDVVTFDFNDYVQ